MKLILYLEIILLSLLTGCKKDTEQMGSIYGIVADKATGEPIRSAGIQLSTGAKIATGSEGQYAFTELKAGEYTLQITKTGYAELLNHKIKVEANKTAKGDIQIEKLPPSLRIVDNDRNNVDTLNFGSAETDMVRSFNIFNDGENKLEWEIIKTAEWISEISKTAGTLNAGATQAVVITINRNKLGNGYNTTTIHIASDNGSKPLTVRAIGKGMPVVSTEEISNLQNTTVTFNGKIVYAGEPEYTERGFVWSTTPQPTITNNIGKQTAIVNSNIIFSVNIIGLQSNTTYYVCAYAKNSQGESYGNVISFSTASISSAVTTSAVSNISVSTATFNANITVEGVPQYSERGFCYSTNNNPTIADNKKITEGFGIGAFSYDVSELERQTTYYIKAYVIQNGAVIYGNIVNFNTIWQTPSLTTSAASNIAATSATLNGNITNIGNPVYTERGFCYSTNSNPTIANNKKTIDDTGIGNYSFDITDLNFQTTYYVRAYVIHNGEPIYGNVVNFTTAWANTTLTTSAVSNIDITSATFNANIMEQGNPAYTERGFCYGTNNMPTIANSKQIASGSGTGSYLLNITGLNYQTTYYVRAYAMQNGQAVYGNVVNFTTYWENASVTTTGTTNIVIGSARFNAVITNMGWPMYSERGFCIKTVNWEYAIENGLTFIPTISDPHYPVSGNGQGQYYLNLSGISEQKVTAVRAYLMQGTDVVYGETDYFITASYPVVTTNPAQNITSTSASLVGSINFPGQPTYTERGFVIATQTTAPTISTLNTAKLVITGENPQFGINCTNLSSGTYYARSYVTNSFGTVYGQTVSFTITN